MARIDEQREPQATPDYRRFTTEDIFTACQTGDAAFIKAALAHPDIAFERLMDQRTGFTPLHFAAAHNARAVVVMLVESGRCALKQPDHWLRRPSAIAYEVANNPALGRYLLMKEAQADRRSMKSIATFPGKSPE
jgi:hypothetical protein